MYLNILVTRHSVSFLFGFYLNQRENYNQLQYKNEICSSNESTLDNTYNHAFVFYYNFNAFYTSIVKTNKKKKKTKQVCGFIQRTLGI